MTELTIEMLDKAIEQIKKSFTEEYNNTIFLPKKEAKLLNYWIQTNTIKQIGNYVKRQGPDGKIWCERLGKINYGYYGFPRYYDEWNSKPIYNRYQRKHLDIINKSLNSKGYKK